jgi:8-oxo-dGTP pyrophosphatase MutT (NUDIX family)
MRELITDRLHPLHESVSIEIANSQALVSDYDLNTRPAAPRNLNPAAVLVPLVERTNGFTVLLTQRTKHLADHAGQISFPGGRAEPGDRGPVETALRETQEEIGLGPDHIEVAGYLDNYETVTAFLVTPVVGFVSPGFTLKLDEFEVAEAFEVPLDFILDPRNHQTHNRIVHGRKRYYYVLEYENRYIWGATAGMLINLFRRVRRKLEA